MKKTLQHLIQSLNQIELFGNLKYLQSTSKFEDVVTCIFIEKNGKEKQHSEDNVDVKNFYGICHQYHLVCIFPFFGVRVNNDSLIFNAFGALAFRGHRG